MHNNIIITTRESTLGIGTSFQCNTCDVDYFSPSGAGPCAACNDGYGTNGLKGQTQCSLLVTPVPTVSPPTPGPSDPTKTPSTIIITFIITIIIIINVIHHYSKEASPNQETIVQSDDKTNSTG